MSNTVAEEEVEEVTRKLPIYMTGAELEKLGKAMYLVKGWKSRLAMDLDVYVSTINRWLNGQTRISKKNAIAIRSLHSSLAPPKRQKEILTVNMNIAD